MVLFGTIDFSMDFMSSPEFSQLQYIILLYRLESVLVFRASLRIHRNPHEELLCSLTAACIMLFTSAQHLITAI